jgi:hypothetical protein
MLKRVLAGVFGAGSVIHFPDFAHAGFVKKIGDGKLHHLFS